MKWEALDEMSQEFVCRSNSINAYVWRGKHEDGHLSWFWRVSSSSSNTVITGYTPITAGSFTEAEEAICWLKSAGDDK